MNPRDYLDGGGNKDRTHTSITHEFGLGVFGGRIGILFDNKTRDFGITVGVSVSKELGKVYIKTQFDTTVPGALEPTKVTPEITYEAFAGLGIAFQKSYDMLTISEQETISVLDGKRGVAGIGIGVSHSIGVSAEVNLSHYFREGLNAVERLARRIEESFDGAEESPKEFEFQAFQSEEHDWHLLDRESHNFEKQQKESNREQLKESNRGLGELSREPIVKDSVLP